MFEHEDMEYCVHTDYRIMPTHYGAYVHTCSHLVRGKNRPRLAIISVIAASSVHIWNLQGVAAGGAESVFGSGRRD